MSALLPALTVHQPWAWAIAHSDKRIENRTWRPPASLLGQFLAIHAGAVPRTKKDHAAMMEVVGQVEADPDQLAFGSVVAVAKVLRCIDMEPSPRSPHYLWWAGPLAWELDEVFALPYPIRAKGKQGLWSLDERQTGCVRLQWKAANRPADLTEEETERLGLMDPATH